MHRFQKTKISYFNVKRFKASLTIEEDKLKTISDMPQAKSLPFIGTRLDLLAAGGGTKLVNFVYLIIFVFSYYGIF